MIIKKFANRLLALVASFGPIEIPTADSFDNSNAISIVSTVPAYDKIAQAASDRASNISLRFISVNSSGNPHAAQLSNFVLEEVKKADIIIVSGNAIDQKFTDYCKENKKKNCDLIEVAKLHQAIDVHLWYSPTCGIKLFNALCTSLNKKGFAPRSKPIEFTNTIFNSIKKALEYLGKRDTGVKSIAISEGLFLNCLNEIGANTISPQAESQCSHTELSVKSLNEYMKKVYVEGPKLVFVNKDVSNALKTKLREYAKKDSSVTIIELSELEREQVAFQTSFRISIAALLNNSIEAFPMLSPLLGLLNISIKTVDNFLKSEAGARAIEDLGALIELKI